LEPQPPGTLWACPGLYRDCFTFTFTMAKAAFDKKKKKKKTLFTSELDLNLKKQLVTCYIWRTALNGAETWTFRKVHQKYPESFKM
jgi:hypothetical protein